MIYKVELVIVVLVCMHYHEMYKTRNLDPLDIMAMGMVFGGSLGDVIRILITPPIDYFNLICNVSLTFITASIFFNDWRKRRKKKPSKVAGIIHNLGHRLVVVPIPTKG